MEKVFRYIEIASTGFILLLVAGVIAWLARPYLEANAAINRFADMDAMPHASHGEGHLVGHLNTYQDGMSSWGISQCFHRTVEVVSRRQGTEPAFYEFDDICFWPRLRAVWQFESHYLTVVTGMGNDSDFIRWEVVSGRYDPCEEATPARLVQAANLVVPLRSP